MDKDEPLFVDAAEEVLDQTQIATLDRPLRFEAKVVIQSVAAVARNGRTAQACGDSMPGHG